MNDEPRVQAPPAPARLEPQEQGQQAPVIPIGTITVVLILMITTIFFWMLALGVQQGRA